MERSESLQRFRMRPAGAAWLGLAALAFAISLAPVLRADDAGAGGRAVRLSYVDGQVRISQDNQVVADPATANVPLFEGMQVATGDDGRAEIQFEDGSVARLSPGSALTLTVLRGQGANGDAELTLNGGLAYFELQGGSDSGQMSVHFGDDVATASGFTVLRVKLDTPPGEFAVFSGNAHLEGGSGALTMDLHGGESLTVMSGDESRSIVSETIEPDSWDAWNSDRDQALTAEASAQTGAASNISPDESQNPAWSDLDANGNWYDVPGQGYVWSPYEAANAGWDPYGYGNWMFTPGYGYIWASGYPWGYLPYQCGAWNYYGGFGWGWAPGLGGCQPWWGTGYYGGPRFGNYLPGGYRPPHRPIAPPHMPGHGRPVPMIAVNRHIGGGMGNLPQRDRNTPVTIAGNTVQPLHPVPMRPGYARPAAEFANHEARVYGSGEARGVNATPRPGYVAGRSAYTAAPEGGQFHPAPASRGYAEPGGRSPSNGAAGGHPSYNGGGAPRGGAAGGSAPRGGGGGMGGGGGAPHGGGGGSVGGGGGSHGGGGGGGGGHK